MNTQVKRLTINLRSMDKDALQKLADIVGEPLSVLVRSILREEIQKHSSIQSKESTTNTQDYHYLQDTK